MKTIKRIAVIGSGIMGSRIACHFAQCGIPVLLLDRISDDETDKNKIVNDSLKNALQASPSPIYSKKFASRIATGNFDDNLKDISNCDWVMEVIIEKLEPKQILFEKVEQFRKQGSIVSTNTNTLTISLTKSWIVKTTIKRNILSHKNIISKRVTRSIYNTT